MVMQTIQIRLTKELIEKAQNLVDEGLYSNKSEVVRDSLRRLVFDSKLSTSKKEFKVIFTADLHGNLVQYEKLFQKAIQENTNAIIIGGDITPKDKKNRTILGQRQFLKNKLIPLIKKFKAQKKQTCEIYIMMGNDDFKSNYYILEEMEKHNLVKLIHDKVIKLHESYKIVGYSFVPLTPFVYKDWEMFDSINEDERKTRSDLITVGVKSKKNSLVKYQIGFNNRKKNIEASLNRLINSDPEKTILVTHSPPYNTNLDMISSKIHVGSRGIRNIIEQKQPLLTLHGHVHETLKYSKDFKQKIGSTISISAANDHVGGDLAIIKFNLYDLDSIEREII